MKKIPAVRVYLFSTYMQQQKTELKDKLEETEILQNYNFNVTKFRHYADLRNIQAGASVKTLSGKQMIGENILAGGAVPKQCVAGTV